MKRSQIKRGDSQLKRSPLNQRSKTNKNRHTANKRIDHSEGIIPCVLQLKGCTGVAEETHEWLGGAKDRNKSIKYGFNDGVCRSCHNAWEQVLTKAEKNAIRADKQLELMDICGWTLSDWMEKFGINFVTDDRYLEME